MLPVSGPRYLIIVGRRHPEQFALLTQLFADDKAIAVLVDRRHPGRETTSRGLSRSTERRRGRPVDDQLHTLGAAVVRASPIKASHAPPGIAAPEGIGRIRADEAARWDDVVLFRYRTDRPTRHTVPVLFVAPPSLRPDIFDLAPGLSMVEHFTAQGLDVFVLDFGSPDPTRCPGFQQYVDQLGSAVERACDISGATTTTLLGYGFAVLYAALQPVRVANLVTVATPVDFSMAGPIYRAAHIVDAEALSGVVGNVAGKWIRDQVAWWSTYVMPEHSFRLWLESSSHVDDPEYWKRQALVARWLNDMRPFSGVAYREFVRELVQANRLARRELRIGERLVDPAQISCPVLVAAHSDDVLMPPSCAMALLGLAGSRDLEGFSVSEGATGTSTFWSAAKGRR